MAHPHTSRSAHRSGGSRLSHRLERLVLVFVVCVPVPAFALSGLNVPLPGVVERVAAALVPWANAGTLDKHALAASTTRGAIVDVPARAAGSDLNRRETARTRTLPSSLRPGASARIAESRSAAAVVPQTGPGTETEPTAADPPPEPTEPHGDGGGEGIPSPQVDPTDPDGGPGNSGEGPPSNPGPTPTDPPNPTPTPVDKPDVKPPDRFDPRPTDDVDVSPSDETETEPADETETKPADKPDSTPAPANDPAPSETPANPGTDRGK